MADMVPIRFVKPTLPYIAGETAWFNELQAAAYIKQGFGERDKSAPPYRASQTRAEMIAEAMKAPR